MNQQVSSSSPVKSKHQLDLEIEDMFDFLTVNVCDRNGRRSDELADAISSFGRLRYSQGVADTVKLGKINSGEKKGIK